MQGVAEAPSLDKKWLRANGCGLRAGAHRAREGFAGRARPAKMILIYGHDFVNFELQHKITTDKKELSPFFFQWEKTGIFFLQVEWEIWREKLSDS